ncbi:hypothetical protein C454_12868 [Haloferax gibbonsii ATCC 33959]|uniref:Uncharacterized protein n=1 Tax=Haloferax gibbonsii (strain ATCC 33959 / DSM 4427 / JCM 8863 / NBRC 102184 / NCIMB 2188 / Ma 2.38) TaxID=1227459 RepID=M0H607_HALGM|nr:hypothetical protein C454_12868 [Haloferax gibbonsii ATCC 33959]
MLSLVSTGVAGVFVESFTRVNSRGRNLRIASVGVVSSRKLRVEWKKSATRRPHGSGGRVVGATKPDAVA